MGTMRLTLLLPVAAALAGCATAERAFMRAPDRALAESPEGPGIRFDDASIEESFRRAEQLVFPMKLAVVGVERNRYGTFEDIESTGFEQALAMEAGLYRDVVPLFDYQVNSRQRCLDMAQLRSAAARAHADAILYYDQKVEIRENFNPLCLLNATLIGLYVLPGTSYEMVLDTRASLVDVRNGVLYTAVRDVRTTGRLAPSAVVDEYARATKRTLRDEAFAAVQASLRDKLGRAREQASARPPAFDYRPAGGPEEAVRPAAPARPRRDPGAENVLDSALRYRTAVPR